MIWHCFIRVGYHLYTIVYGVHFDRNSSVFPHHYSSHYGNHLSWSFPAILKLLIFVFKKIGIEQYHILAKITSIRLNFHTTALNFFYFSIYSDERLLTPDVLSFSFHGISYIFFVHEYLPHSCAHIVQLFLMLLFDTGWVLHFPALLCFFSVGLRYFRLTQSKRIQVAQSIYTKAARNKVEFYATLYIITLLTILIIHSKNQLKANQRQKSIWGEKRGEEKKKNCKRMWGVEYNVERELWMLEICIVLFRWILETMMARKKQCSAWASWLSIHTYSKNHLVYYYLTIVALNGRNYISARAERPILIFEYWKFIVHIKTFSKCCQRK